MKFLLRWHPPRGEAHREGLLRELKQEISTRHVLHGWPLRIIGYRQDDDDVLVEVLDGSDRLAVVHLTYAKRPEPYPDFPWTTIYESWERFERECMRPNHEGRPAE